MRLIKIILNLYRLVPAWICVNSLSSCRKDMLIEEMNYWGKCTRRDENGFNLFSNLILTYKEYRNLLIFRVGGGTQVHNQIYVSSYGNALY